MIEVLKVRSGLHSDLLSVKTQGFCNRSLDRDRDCDCDCKCNRYQVKRNRYQVKCDRYQVIEGALYMGQVPVVTQSCGRSHQWSRASCA